jgi:hypothetical protein
MQDVEPANPEREDAPAPRRPWVEPSFVVVPVADTSNGGVIGINDGITAES